MLCPNCTETMKSAYYDSQFVQHCSSCGATFFEENGINRITFDTAYNLSKDKYRTYISSKEKVCPKDFSPLKSITNTEAVPSHIILFLCPSCSGVLVYPDDLLKFKKAQGAKIDYYKSWQRPFASVHAVLVVFVIVVLSAATFLTLSTFQERASLRSEASDLFKSLGIFRSGRYTLISFRTNVPLRSKIILISAQTGKVQERIISPELTLAHQVVLADISEKEPYTYKIILSDAKGRVIETELRKLVVTR